MVVSSRSRSTGWLKRKDPMMKTSFTTLAVLAAVAFTAPAFAQGNSFFNYQDTLPSRAERQHLEQVAQREKASQPAYALTGSTAPAKTTPAQSLRVPGNGSNTVELPAH